MENTNTNIPSETYSPFQEQHMSLNWNEKYNNNSQLLF